MQQAISNPDRISRGFCLIASPGLLESAYEECPCHELSLQQLKYERQKHLPVTYTGISLDCGYRLDDVVEKKVIHELKTVERPLPVHEAQFFTYLKMTGLSLGLLINFEVPVLNRISAVDYLRVP